MIPRSPNISFSSFFSDPYYAQDVERIFVNIDEALRSGELGSDEDETPEAPEAAGNQNTPVSSNKTTNDTSTAQTERST